MSKERSIHNVLKEKDTRYALYVPELTPIERLC